MKCFCCGQFITTSLTCNAYKWPLRTQSMVYQVKLIGSILENLYISSNEFGKQSKTTQSQADSFFLYNGCHSSWVESPKAWHYDLLVQFSIKGYCSNCHTIVILLSQQGLSPLASHDNMLTTMLTTCVLAIFVKEFRDTLGKTTGPDQQVLSPESE